MKSTSHVVLAAWLLGGVLLSAQSTPVPSEQKKEPAAPSFEQIRSTPSGGNLEILNDTMGVDFGPYLDDVLKKVRLHWYSLIPDVARPPLMKKGKVSINFAILKDGSVTGIKLDESSGDGSLDGAAWDGIAKSGPLPPLPNEFKGQYLRLRFHFYYNPDRPISIRRSGTMSVGAGTSRQFEATMGTKDIPVKWSLAATGCEGAACGTISDTGLYTAPTKVPNPPFVTVKAALESDPSNKDSVSVEIVAESH